MEVLGGVPTDVCFGMYWSVGLSWAGSHCKRRYDFPRPNSKSSIYRVHTRNNSEYCFGYVARLSLIALFVFRHTMIESKIHVSDVRDLPKGANLMSSDPLNSVLLRFPQGWLEGRRRFSSRKSH